jgi:uncharacterized protein
LSTSVIEDPLEVIRAYFRAVDANDIDGVMRLFHEEIVYERPGYGEISGKQRLRHFYSEERIIARGHHEIEGMVADGDRVVAWGSFVGSSRAGGELNERFCDVYEMRDSTMYRRRTYFFRPAV